MGISKRWSKSTLPRTALAILAAVGLVGAFAGPANAVEPVRDSRGSVTLAAAWVVAQFCAVDTEDASTDEIYVKRNGTTVWGPRSIGEGSCLRTVIPVNYGDVIDLYDRDNPNIGDHDDWLGTQTIHGIDEYLFDVNAVYKMWTECCG